MAHTMQQVCDLARIPLNDDDKQRAPDATKVLPFARSALLLLQARRPDLFFGMFSSMPDIPALALTDAFPLDDIVVQAVADYITARVEAGNDESVLEQRAGLFFDLFKGQI